MSHTTKIIKFEFIYPDVGFCTLLCKLLQDNPRIDSCVWAFEVSDTYTGDVPCDQVITFQSTPEDPNVDRPEKLPYLLVTKTASPTITGDANTSMGDDLIDIIKREFCTTCEEIKAWVLRFQLD